MSMTDSGHHHHIPDPDDLPDLRIYSHSPLFYWWPMWVLGFLFAGLTAVQGESVAMGNEGRAFLVHPSKYLGLIYTATFLLLLLTTTATVRGLASIVVMLVIVLTGVLLAWLQLFDDLVEVIPYLGMHMTLGFFLVTATGVFVMWALAFFVFDRMAFWRIRPGQMTFERWVGDAEKSYDTRGLLFEKKSEDYFKQLLLGLGMGDLSITTSGARKEEIDIPNVIFVDSKVKAIQRLIAIKPDEVMGDGH